ncbi:uncharacterized protein A4U43_C05F13270 [Asparagus officinalis]|uniref:Uncharacterized protein n=1 Tax=Asparagus officinalis TaxID=4686 RepID=A0A5P1EVP3_ASPOF|nr:uncharacterized protein A4U43_C05F13270 [Asparagus officinalis]
MDAQYEEYSVQTKQASPSFACIKAAAIRYATPAESGTRRKKDGHLRQLPEMEANPVTVITLRTFTSSNSNARGAAINQPRTPATHHHHHHPHGTKTMKTGTSLGASTWFLLLSSTLIDPLSSIDMYPY